MDTNGGLKIIEYGDKSLSTEAVLSVGDCATSWPLIFAKLAEQASLS